MAKTRYIRAVTLQPGMRACGPRGWGLVLAVYELDTHVGVWMDDGGTAYPFIQGHDDRVEVQAPIRMEHRLKIIEQQGRAGEFLYAYRPEDTGSVRYVFKNAQREKATSGAWLSASTVRKRSDYYMTHLP